MTFDELAPLANDIAEQGVQSLARLLMRGGVRLTSKLADELELALMTTAVQVLTAKGVKVDRIVTNLRISNHEKGPSGDCAGR
jgi:hypothetical protein